QDRIDDPAPAGMRLRGAAVTEDLLVIAPSILQRVAEDRHRGEVAGVVNVLGETADCGREPLRIPFEREEGIGEELAEGIGKQSAGETAVAFEGKRRDGRNATNPNAVQVISQIDRIDLLFLLLKVG